MTRACRQGCGRPADPGRTRCAACLRKESAAKLRRRYGVTPAIWERLILDQGGRCSICGVQLRDPCLDHCHDTGRVRGVLCRQCNTGLGHATDDPARLVAMAHYLHQHRQTRKAA